MVSNIIIWQYQARVEVTPPQPLRAQSRAPCELNWISDNNLLFIFSREIKTIIKTPTGGLATKSLVCCHQVLLFKCTAGDRSPPSFQTSAVPHISSPEDTCWGSRGWKHGLCASPPAPVLWPPPHSPGLPSGLSPPENPAAAGLLVWEPGIVELFWCPPFSVLLDSSSSTPLPLALLLPLPAIPKCPLGNQGARSFSAPSVNGENGTSKIENRTWWAQVFFQGGKSHGGMMGKVYRKVRRLYKCKDKTRH